MEYSELLTVIYGNDLSKIIRVLNQSLYATDFICNEEYPLIAHTGFSFDTHKGRRIDLLFHFKTKKIIRQARAYNFSLPQINGLIVTRMNEKYINHFLELMVINISVDKNEEPRFYYLKDSNKYIGKDLINEVIVTDEQKTQSITVESFKLVSNNKVVREFPLYRNFEHSIFFDGKVFKDFDPNKKSYKGFSNDYKRQSFGEYTGTWAQDIEGLSDDFINDVLDGNPDAYWNID